MNPQTEITTPGALLDGKGGLARPGFSRSLVQNYRRADVKVSPLRIKEWDYYLVNNGRFALALTVADNGYMGLDSVSLLDLEEGWEITKSPMSFLPLGRKHLPETSVTGDVHSANAATASTSSTRGKSASSSRIWTNSARAPFPPASS